MRKEEFKWKEINKYSTKNVPRRSQAGIYIMVTCFCNDPAICLRPYAKIVF